MTDLVSPLIASTKYLFLFTPNRTCSTNGTIGEDVKSQLWDKEGGKPPYNCPDKGVQGTDGKVSLAELDKDEDVGGISIKDCLTLSFCAVPASSCLFGRCEADKVL